MSNERKNFSDQYSRGELLDLVLSYRFPEGVDGVTRTYYQIFEKMKQDKVLPDSWTSPSSLNKFMLRLQSSGVLPKNWKTKNYLQNYFEKGKNTKGKLKIEITNDIEILDLVKPLIKNLQIGEKEKFIIYWRNLSKSQRSEFFDWVAVPFIHSGIPLYEICNTLVKKFSELGLIDENTVRSCISSKFKNSAMSERKLGKTFESSGRNPKGAI